MILFREKGMALLTVTVIIFILTILSSVILTVLSNQTKIIEHSIARTKAKYANEAAMVREVELLRKNITIDKPTHNVSGRYDSSQNWGVNITNSSSSGRIEINLSTQYGTTF